MLLILPVETTPPARSVRENDGGGDDAGATTSQF
jgi:hypothetical protein